MTKSELAHWPAVRRRSRLIASLQELAHCWEQGFSTAIGTTADFLGKYAINRRLSVVPGVGGLPGAGFNRCGGHLQLQGRPRAPGLPHPAGAPAVYCRHLSAQEHILLAADTLLKPATALSTAHPRIRAAVGTHLSGRPWRGCRLTGVSATPIPSSAMDRGIVRVSSVQIERVDTGQRCAAGEQPGAIQPAVPGAGAQRRGGRGAGGGRHTHRIQPSQPGPAHRCLVRSSDMCFNINEKHDTRCGRGAQR